MGLINGGESLWTRQPLRALTNPLPRASVGKPDLSCNDNANSEKPLLAIKNLFVSQSNVFFQMGVDN